ncbi:MAG: RHS repeat-associated core domain-containing protein [Chloroflexi bacterium]|nr:RHS repeat-associated core domain-containing protein [Chloroflexota bacterium]
MLNSAGGNLIESYDYNAFGDFYQSPTSMTTKFGYTGQQYDAGTGLYFLRARYYDPAIGRFLSQDPYLVNTGNPVELNRYVYTANNPVNYADPSGLQTLVTKANIEGHSVAWSKYLGPIGVAAAAIFAAVAVALLVSRVIEDVGNPPKNPAKPWEREGGDGGDPSEKNRPDDGGGGGGGMPGPGGGGGGGGFGDIVKRIVFAAVNIAIGAAVLFSNFFKGADDTFQAKPGYRTQYEQTTEEVDEATDNSRSMDLVYRNPSVRSSEHPRALINGFFPKNPAATYHVAYHITHGNKVDTQYVSTTRSFIVALQHKEPGLPIYVIDLNRVPGKKYDFTIPSVAEEYLKNPYTRNLAVRAHEVTVEGPIPPEAILTTIN